MQARIQQWFQRIRPLTAQLRHGLEWFIQGMRRSWQWFNSLDIPLSAIQWILLFYAIFSIGYITATPIFEANDEIWHFGYLQRLRETGSLPQPALDGSETIYAQHGGQPPLYYGLMALLTSPFHIDDAAVYRRLNPHVRANQPDSFGNKNLTVHDESRSMLTGTGLVVLMIRGFGLVLGAGTIVMIHKISRYIAPQRPTVAFAAAAITAFNPMFIFVSASVSNDSLAMILNAALVLLMLRTLRDSFNLQYTLAIGLLFGLTSITKLTSIVLWPVLIGLGIVVYYRTKDRRGLLWFLLSLFIFWGLIAAWWHIRNLQLYGEPFGMMTMANIAGPRGAAFSLANLFAEYQQFRMSYWGLFGALNIQITAIFYILLDLMTFLSVIGCALLVLQLLAIRDFAYARYELRHLLLLLSILMLLWMGVLYWSAVAQTAQGRVLFPLIAVISPIIAVGFVETVWWIVFSLRPPNLEFVRAGDAVPKELLHETMLWPLRFLGIVALLAPFTVIANQYAIPEPLSALPDNARPVYAEFGDAALIGYKRINRRYVPGDRVRVTLYWEVRAQSEQDHSIYLSLVDDNRQEIGRYASYPGAGSLRTSQWKAGAIYADEYIIPIDADAFGRYPFDLQVKWENLARGEPIAATNLEGDSIEPVLLDAGAVVYLRAQPASPGFAEIATELQPNFDDVIRLQEFLIDADRNEVILNWKAESTPSENYTVFMHMLDEGGNIVEQADAPPRLPTAYWRWGESYLTYHSFPADFNMLEHTIIVGWYLNDGLTYPRAEYRIQTETEEELFFDSYTLSWDLAYKTFELTEEAKPQVTMDPNESSQSETKTPQTGGSP